MVKVEIDEGSGFCFGVVTAINKAEEELANGGTLYCLGDIVHNSREVERLKEMGLITINHDDFNHLHDAKVLLRAHGEPPETYEIARRNNIEIIDATCPVVLRLQKKIKQEYTQKDTEDKQIVIYGKTGHAEVLGLVGQTTGEAIVIEKLEEAKKLDFTRSIRLYSQTTKSLDEFQKIVLSIVSKIIIPVLPFFIGLTFCGLAYEGSITKQLPVFLKVIVIVLIGHFIWMTLLYVLAGIYSHENPWEVVRNYGPAYLTAVGTMSSAATLAVALQCAGKAKPLRKDMVQFGIPLFANIHLCGSVLTEVFFCMTISKMLYGSIPAPGTMVLFCLLLGIFALGAPGVPGGTVMASLGIITGVLGFNETGTALMLTIFALQDSFGTACNVTGDGALTLILTGYAKKHNIKEQHLDMIDL